MDALALLHLPWGCFIRGGVMRIETNKARSLPCHPLHSPTWVVQAGTILVSGTIFSTRRALAKSAGPTGSTTWLVVDRLIGRRERSAGHVIMQQASMHACPSLAFLVPAPVSSSTRQMRQVARAGMLGCAHRVGTKDPAARAASRICGLGGGKVGRLGSVRVRACVGPCWTRAPPTHGPCCSWARRCPSR